MRQQLLAHAALTLQDPALKRKVWLSLAALAEQRNDAEAAQLAYRRAAQL
jgi:HemY protein